MGLEDIRGERIKKLEALKEKGIDPYPASSSRSFSIGELLNTFEGRRESEDTFTIAGRVMALREQGGVTFGDLRDESEKMQVLFKEDILGDAYKNLVAGFDIGDFIEVTGSAFVTKRGEKTVEAHATRMLAKSIRPLPDKWHGLVDVEERLRRRYVDLAISPAERDFFRKKSRFWRVTREFLIQEGFLEVETPVLESTPGGADAEPFTTHLNALDIDLYLRISPELHLKRLLVGGYEKVFEIGRIFRNEGIDRDHLQDYTQMEVYWAYADYEMMMEVVERLVKYVMAETFGPATTEWQGYTLDWSKPWPRIDYYEVFEKYTGINLAVVSENDLKSYAEEEGIDTVHHPGKGRLIDVIFKKKVRPTLIQPGFLVLPPIEVVPLAKRHRNDPARGERFQVVACGTELGNGWTELNDPLDQRTRFEEQVRLREAGDAEAQMMDEDFVEAMEYGMPPAAGFGYSERLFAVLTGRSIRETVFFPVMRPRKHD